MSRPGCYLASGLRCSHRCSRCCSWYRGGWDSTGLSQVSPAPEPFPSPSPRFWLPGERRFGPSPTQNPGGLSKPGAHIGERRWRLGAHLGNPQAPALGCALRAGDLTPAFLHPYTTCWSHAPHLSQSTRPRAARPPWVSLEVSTGVTTAPPRFLAPGLRPCLFQGFLPRRWMHEIVLWGYSFASWWPHNAGWGRSSSQGPSSDVLGRKSCGSGLGHHEQKPPRPEDSLSQGIFSQRNRRAEKEPAGPWVGGGRLSAFCGSARIVPRSRGRRGGASAIQSPAPLLGTAGHGCCRLRAKGKSPGIAAGVCSRSGDKKELPLGGRPSLFSVPRCWKAKDKVVVWREREAPLPQDAEPG